MSDRFANYALGLESPAVNLIEITPNDTQDLSEFSRALNVAVSGMVRVTTVRGDTATINIAAGIPFPVRVRRVWQTGTTASGICALY